MVGYDAMRQSYYTILNSYGEIMSLKYYTSSGADAGYDDDRAFTASGTLIWTSGLIFGLSSAGDKGSSEAILVEQGKITYDDAVIYFRNDVSFSGAAIKIGIGSPNYETYQILVAGVDDHPMGSQQVYKKIYARILNNGSFIGEA